MTAIRYDEVAMKAAVFHQPRDIRIEEVPTPTPGPGEIVIRTEVALTCGTDLKMYRRGHPLAKPPTIMGHEFSGVIESLAPDVKNFSVGIRVVAVNSAPCDNCFYCKNGQQNLCEKLDEAIIGFSWPGAYAQYVRIPSHIVRKNTYAIPARLSFHEAAILEPLGCVVHGAHSAGIKSGDNVVIVGTGPIALLHVQVARSKGVREAIVVGRTPEKLRLAERLGATGTINTSEADPKTAVMKLTAGRGADVTIEAVGQPETWESAVGLTRKGGTVLLFGGCAKGSTAAIDTYAVHYGELTLRGAFHHTPASVKEALDLLRTGSVKADELISASMPLRNLVEAFDLMEASKVSKVAIETQTD